MQLARYGRVTQPSCRISKFFVVRKCSWPVILCSFCTELALVSPSGQRDACHQALPLHLDEVIVSIKVFAPRDNKLRILLKARVWAALCQPVSVARAPQVTLNTFTARESVDGEP